MGITQTYSGGSITFLANTFGNSKKNRETSGGFEYKRYKVTPRDEYWLDYWIKPDKNWIEGLGGKLMGLGGGMATTGGAPVTPAGWSLRMMWGDYRGLRGYRYDQDRNVKYGINDPLASTKKFKVNEWSRVTEHVKLNAPNKRDGKAHFWINGNLELDLNNVKWRGNVDRSTAQINIVMLQPFRGGGSDIWAVDKDTKLYFSDFYLCDEQPNLSTGTWNTPPTFGTDNKETLESVLAENGIIATFDDHFIKLKIPRI